MVQMHFFFQSQSFAADGTRQWEEDIRTLKVFSLSSTSSTLELKENSVCERSFSMSRQRRNNPRSVNRDNELGETLLFDA